MTSAIGQAARELYTFDVTIPAGTSKAAPATTSIRIPVRIVTKIQVLVPPGPNGTVGFRLAAAGQQIIPVNVNSWVIASGATLEWAFTNLIESGAWQLVGHNTGGYDHTLQVRFEVAMPPIPEPAAPTAAPDLTGLSTYTPADLAALIAAEDAQAGVP